MGNKLKIINTNKSAIKYCKTSLSYFRIQLRPQNELYLHDTDKRMSVVRVYSLKLHQKTNS